MPNGKDDWKTVDRPGPRRSVTYARISRVERKRETVENIDEQIAECAIDADDHGDETVAVFQDNMTASEFKLHNRPDYQAMVAKVRAGDVDVIRVTEQSRLDRELWNVLELIELARTTPLQGIRLVREGTWLWLRNEGDVNRAIDQANRDRHEAWVIGDRTKRKKKVRAGQGSFNGGVRPFGYDRIFVEGKPGDPDYVQASLKINEREAATIREIRAMLKRGRSLYGITAELNARGITTVTGARWQPTSLRVMLQNKTIIGIRVHHGVEHEASWPAILTPSEWDDIQSILAAKKHATSGHVWSRKYLLTGLLKCGNCGGDLTGHGYHGGEHLRYFCRVTDAQGNRTGCDKVARMKAPIEAMIRELVIRRFDDEGMSKMLSVATKSQEAADLNAQYQDTKRSLAEVVADYYRERDKYVKDAIGKERTRITNELHAIIARMGQVESTRALASIPIGQTMREAWDGADDDLRRSFVELVIERVIVHPGKTGATTWTDPASGETWRFDPRKIEIVWR